MHVMSVSLIPAVAGSCALYRQEAYAAEDTLQTVLVWSFMVGVGLFMLTILFKALVSLPRCSECGCRMKNISTISISESQIFGFKDETIWRVVECSSCRKQYRIPGLS